MPAPLSIRLQTLDGTWEECGTDRMPAVKPESVQLTANTWGSDTCSFQLKRPLDGVYPDLYAFTPCRVRIAGVLVWSGEIWETPAAEAEEPVIQVQGRGRQYELDDDPFERVWVHTRLEDYKDQRSSVAVDLSRDGVAAASVEVGSGAVVIGWPKESAISANNPYAGVVLDLGVPDAKRISVTYQKVGGTSTANLAQFYVRGGDSDDLATSVAASREDLPGTHLSPHAISTSLTTLSASFTTPRRYVGLMMFFTAAAAGLTEDNSIRITSIRIYRQPAYESGGESVLKASDVFKDSIAFAPQLSQDAAEIQTPTTSLPEYAPFEDRSPRDHIDAANDPLGWQSSVLVDGRTRFRPWPVKPKYRATRRAQFRDTSMNSGEPIYNRAVVKAQLENGSKLRVERYAGQLPGTKYEAISSPALVNPSFDTDLTGWTVTNATAVRDTTTFHSSPASAHLTGVNPATKFVGATTGVFRKGFVYRVSLAIRLLATAATQQGFVRFGVPLDDYSDGFYIVKPGNSGVWTAVDVIWAPRSDYASGVPVVEVFGALPVTIEMWVDTVVTYLSIPTILDRRRRLRTKVINVGAALDVATMQGMGDSFLQESLRTPLRGPMTVPLGGLMPYMGSEDVHPSRALLDGGELVHLPTLADPVTGKSGRAGRIDTVTYDHSKEESAVTIDESRSAFDAVLASYGVSAA